MAVRDCYENQERGFAVQDERQLTIADVEGVMSNGDQPAVEFTGEIHPAADKFRMLTEAELDAMAADVAANGLIHPIVLDAEGRLVDGRNRLAACRRAGVDPVFTPLNGEDPVLYICRVNSGRRHDSQGQRTMAVVMAACDENYKFVIPLKDLSDASQIPIPRLSEGHVILKEAPDIAEAVRDGAIPFSAGLDLARKRKEKRQKEAADQARIEREHPELAVLVKEEKLKLEDAVAKADALDEERGAKEAERRKYINLRTQQLDAALIFLDPNAMNPDQWAEQCLEINPDVIGPTADFSAERARRAADLLLRYAALKESKENGKE